MKILIFIEQISSKMDLLLANFKLYYSAHIRRVPRQCSTFPYWLLGVDTGLGTRQRCAGGGRETEDIVDILEDNIKIIYFNSIHISRLRQIRKLFFRYLSGVEQPKFDFQVHY